MMLEFSGSYFGNFFPTDDVKQSSCVFRTITFPYVWTKEQSHCESSPKSEEHGGARWERTAGAEGCQRLSHDND